jgi:hypothetical protein
MVHRGNIQGIVVGHLRTVGRPPRRRAGVGDRAALDVGVAGGYWAVQVTSLSGASDVSGKLIARPCQFQSQGSKLRSVTPQVIAKNLPSRTHDGSLSIPRPPKGVRSWRSPCHFRAICQGVLRSITVTHGVSPDKHAAQRTYVNCTSLSGAVSSRCASMALDLPRIVLASVPSVACGVPDDWSRLSQRAVIALARQVRAVFR